MKNLPRPTQLVNASNWQPEGRCSCSDRLMGNLASICFGPNRGRPNENCPRAQARRAISWLYILYKTAIRPRVFSSPLIRVIIGAVFCAASVRGPLFSIRTRLRDDRSWREPDPPHGRWPAHQAIQSGTAGLRAAHHILVDIGDLPALPLGARRSRICNDEFAGTIREHVSIAVEIRRVRRYPSATPQWPAMPFFITVS